MIEKILMRGITVVLASVIIYWTLTLHQTWCLVLYKHYLLESLHQP